MGGGRGLWGFPVEQDPHMLSDPFSPGHSVPDWGQDSCRTRLPVWCAGCACVPSPPPAPFRCQLLFPSPLGLLTKGHVHLLSCRVFVIRLVSLGISSVSQAEVPQIANKMEQLTDTTCDGGTLGFTCRCTFYVQSFTES